MKLPLGINPQDTPGLLREVIRERDRTNRHLTFGDPNTTAGEPGTPGNIEGNWVTVDLAAGPNTITHDLGLPVSSASTPNVGWLVFGAKAAGDLHYAGGTVTTNSIVLTWTGAGPTDRAIIFFIQTGDW